MKASDTGTIKFLLYMIVLILTGIATAGYEMPLFLAVIIWVAVTVVFVVDLFK